LSQPANQSGFWDQAAAAKEFTHPLDHLRLRRALALDAAILDYGCGQGRICGQLAQLGYQNLLGVDFSEQMIRTAKARNPDLSFSVVDGRGLPYANGTFDAVLLIAVLTCIPSDAAQRSLIAELSRVLRPGGLLLVSDYPLQTDERNQGRYELFADQFGNYGTFRLSDGAVVRHHRREWFNELLAGYSIEETVELDAKTMNGNPAHILQFWSRRK